ncbi:hypothetical protein TWF106_011254 [Orbilia oligospora]|uniref:Uncharacterized protein n=1 Tax=Orbilia oligospora TaxID=2813651 RepID=A0A7C8Q129_ORBOL|nr:hypothetical protein TWF788_002937 [Orbilia oligospora]KAF3226843.1 hypothetical protein TWF106_011254 [Orbilia oligospora]
MGEAFGIQLAFMLEDSREKTSPATDMTMVAAATVKSTLTRASPSSVRDTSFCENFYKFDLQPKVSTTWPKGYKHPIQEWEFCPLQQGHSVHPTMAITRKSRPVRPTIEIPPHGRSLVPPHGKSLSLSMRASHRELGSRESITAQSHSRARAMSESKARGSMVVSPGLWQKKRLATQQLNYDKNRPLPPLPLRIKKNEGEGLQVSLSFRRKRENVKRRQLQQQMELADIQPNTGPTPIKLPPKYIQEQSPKMEAITPGMADAEVVTIGFDAYAPPMPEINQNQLSNRDVSGDNHDDGLSLFDFSFVPGASVDRAPAEEPISPFNLKGAVDENLETDLPIKAKRFGCLPMKLRLDLPESATSKSPTTCRPEDEVTEMEKMREQAGSRCVGREETVYNQDGVEERRYVYYPTRLSMDLQRSSSILQQKRVSLNRQPSSYTQFPPHNPEGGVCEHQKKPSTSSSRSQMTFSTFGGAGHNNKYAHDHESQVTDCEDYEADEDEDTNENYTCASSFVSASSYPSSEMSAGDDGSFTPVPQRLSAASKKTTQSEKHSSRATMVEADTAQVPPLPYESSTPTSAAATPHINFGLPPTSTEHHTPRKTSGASHILTSGRPASVQSFISESRLSSNSCSNLKAVSDQTVPLVPPVPSVEISRALSPETTASHINNSEGLGAQSPHPPCHKMLGRRSLTPTPSMFRNGDGGNNGKLRVIEEEPHQQRPNTAPAAPECQGSRSFFEDYDDTEDIESGFSKVKRFLARCLSVKSRPPSGVHESDAIRKKSEVKRKAKKAEGVQETMKKNKDKKHDEKPAPPPRPSSRFSRISRISKLGRSSGKWRWSYAMMGATFS